MTHLTELLRGLPFLLLALLAVALIGCDGGGTGEDGEPDVAPPSVARSIEDQELEADEDPVEIDVGDVFEGEDLTFSASSSDPGVADATMSGTTLTVEPENGGSAAVTVTAENEAGEASEDFAVDVDLPSAPDPPDS